MAALDICNYEQFSGNTTPGNSSSEWRFPVLEK